jgi:outer membrane protein OmpA-like peptidoglycan-associated protein
MRTGLGTRRWSAVSVAVVGLLAIGVAQDVPNRHRMERDLTRRSLDALHGEGMSNVEVSFAGRDGTVRVGSAADAGRALRIVRAQRGVRVAHVVAPAPVGTPPSVRLAIDGGRAVIEGTVPSQAARDTLTAAAATAFGPGAVTDRLTVDRGVADAGIAGLPAVLSAVGKDASVVVELRNGVLRLSGTVTSPAAREATLAAATTAVGPAAVVDRLMVVRPGGADQTVQTQLDAMPPVTFETGSAVLTPEGSQILARVAAILSANPTVRVVIRGHTDSDGTPESNLTLSQARAQAVLDALRALGIAADRLTALGLGQTQPKVPNSTQVNKAVNRRVEFLVVP